MPLHPVFANALEAGRRAGRPALSGSTVEAARAFMADSAKALGDGPPLELVRDLTVPTRAGSVGARLFRSTAPAPALIVYFHGGGWVAGSVAGFDALGRSLATRTGCAVLSVDYRLAPETPFPGPLEDAEDAIRWAAAHRAELADDGAKIIVGGDSAGGNLATVAALALRGQVDIALQLLFYPVTDCDFNTASYREFAEGQNLTRADMQWFFRHYAPEAMWADPRIAPMRADLAGAPPAWLGLAEVDVLRSEGQAYAQRLAAAGVPVQVRTFAGLPHAYARWFNLVDAVDVALDDAAQAARAALAG
ncbi:MAG: alpha/beta hydrolase [Burkholderiales bacterium]